MPLVKSSDSSVERWNQWCNQFYIDLMTFDQTIQRWPLNQITIGLSLIGFYVLLSLSLFPSLHLPDTWFRLLYSCCCHLSTCYIWMSDSQRLMVYAGCNIELEFFIRVRTDSEIIWSVESFWFMIYVLYTNEMARWSKSQVEYSQQINRFKVSKGLVVVTLGHVWTVFY